MGTHSSAWMPRGPRRTIAALGLATAGVLSVIQPVAASPIDDKRAEATVLADRLERLGDKVSQAAEEANRARTELTRISRDLEVVRKETARIETETGQTLAQLRSHATKAYVQGPSGPARSDADTDHEPLVKVQYLNLVSGRQADALDKARAAMARAKAQREKLAGAEARAREARGRADRAAADATRAEEETRTTLAGVRVDLEQLVQEERERIARERAEREAAQARAAADAAVRRQAEAEAAARQREEQERAAQSRAAQQAAAPQPLSRPAGAAPAARPAPNSTPKSAPAPNAATPAPAGPSSGAGAAVAFAMAQVGKPYRWGAEGPGSYDCSGLTLAAWRAGGKSLPHFTGAQYNATTKVSVSQIQPGDLVFYGSYPFHHMGMYVGNGNTIDAPYTGANVRVRPLSARTPSAVTRP